MRLLIAACLGSLLMPSTVCAQDPQSFRPAPVVTGQGETASVAEAEAEASVLGRAAVIAGVETYSELMSDYAGTPLYGPSRAVGRLLREDALGPMPEGSAFERCTAWLVARDVIMTARHCLPEAVGELAANVNVQFGYHIEAEATQPNTAPYRVGEILEADDDLDYLLARVVVAPGQASPGSTFGIIRVASDGEVRHGEPLQVIHHPFGFSQLLIKDGTCRAIDYPEGAPSYLYHRCDTWSGSSGSPVLSYLPGWLPAAQYRTEPVAVGLHRAGQALANENSLNIAVRLPDIVAQSEILRPIACTFAADGWRCPSIDRPTAQAYFFPFPPGSTSYPTAPGTALPSSTIRNIVNRVRADVGDSVEFVRIRIYGDATLEEWNVPPGYPMESRARYREAMASTRASAIWYLLGQSSVLPSPASGTTWTLDMGHSRSDPGGAPARPNRSGVEVFIDYLPLE